MNTLLLVGCGFPKKEIGFSVFSLLDKSSSVVGNWVSSYSFHLGCACVCRHMMEVAVAGEGCQSSRGLDSDLTGNN